MARTVLGQVVPGKTLKYLVLEVVSNRHDFNSDGVTLVWTGTGLQGPLEPGRGGADGLRYFDRGYLGYMQCRAHIYHEATYGTDEWVEKVDSGVAHHVGKLPDGWETLHKMMKRLVARVPERKYDAETSNGNHFFYDLVTTTDPQTMMAGSYNEPVHDILFDHAYGDAAADQTIGQW
ncbi:unnamed protein product, partial [Amoebophrya sp. A120]|eukprot:GSA120T00024896001.1